LIRSVKYGLYGAVLAGVVSGTVAWQSVDKTVHLVVDGNRSTIHTTQSRVSGVLSGAGYKVGPHDIVAPQADARVKNGGTVVLARGRLLLLDVNGVQSEVWTTASTVAGAMAQLGYSTADFTSVSRDRRLPLTPTDLTIRTPQSVIVKHDGRTDTLATTDVTVGQLLDDLGMALGPKDTVEPAASTEITSGLTVTVHRVVSKKISETAALPYGTTYQKSDSLGVGTSAVVKLGHDGQARNTYAVVIIDGKIVGKTLVGTKILTQPINRVVIVGTGTPSSAGGSAAAGPAAPPVPAGAIATPAQAMDIARQLLAARGWSDQMDNCLVPMWEHESGWRVQAGNPSGAYGIPQALPGYKMQSAGADWQTNAATQITWGLNYIAGHYGTPCAAWSFWQAHSWY
jgi:uncharacterized protein YabE (DUF348 family)